MVKLSLSTKILAGVPTCKDCRDHHRTTADFSHPTWKDAEGTTRFDIPPELQDLREGEKLLIQQVSPYVPLQHLQQGSYGSKGHVCSFPQDIGHVCTVLPRVPNDVSIVKVVKEFTDKQSNVQKLTFKIRREKVLTALRWLKRHNTEYQSITIEEDNLTWMETDEEDLPHHDQEPVNTDQDPVDVNPSDSFHSYGVTEAQRDSAHGTYGYISTPRDRGLPQAKDDNITNRLNEAYDPQNKSKSIDFPYVGERAVNEYDKTSKLFCKAFPWLFPGGKGDINDYSEVKETVDQWMKRLLYYQDGRFAKDKMWAFFALNYAIRKKNCDSGAYFVNGFFDDGPQTLQELQECIRNGDIGWINRLAYFSYHVKGSPGYWRFKRSEVYSWINHHIECGHGAPTLFITLSCAEYHWKDIKRLVEQRLSIAGLKLCPSQTSYTSLVNDYTLIVQEYFQKRIEIWLKTVGKHIFGIQHHWLRYEFAPGRGQIHAHMLAISSHKQVFKDSFNSHDNPTRQAEILSKWASETFGLTASLPDSQNADTHDNHGLHPSSLRFVDIKDYNEDATDCLLHLQYHRCGSKCMKKRKRRYELASVCV